MTNYMELPTGPDIPYTINAVIEIPRGSINKYEYDKQLNIFCLDRTLYSPVHYPGDYGFIPQTHAEDGDPLDVVVIIDQTTFTGCMMQVRPLGVLVMRDDKGLDHKILAVPVADQRMRDVHGLQHLPSHYLKEIDYFFNIYKELEGKKSDTYGWEDRVVAYTVIEQCVQRYKDLKEGLIDRWGEVTAKGKRKAPKSIAMVAEDDRGHPADALAGLSPSGTALVKRKVEGVVNGEDESTPAPAKRKAATRKAIASKATATSKERQPAVRKARG